MKLTGEAMVLSNSTYTNKKGELVRVVTLGDPETFEKKTFFNVPVSLEVPEPKSVVNFEVSLREYKNKQGFNQLACYLNSVSVVE